MPCRAPAGATRTGTNARAPTGRETAAMPFAAPPPFAAWRHVGAREGFEVVFIERDGDGCRVEGTTTGVEDGRPWATRYVITLGADWATRSARVTTRELEVEL